MSTGSDRNVEVTYQGCRLVATIRGEGTPVVWIQGVGVHGDGWLPQIDALRDRFACLSFDNREMGKSRPVSGSDESQTARPITIEQMADDLFALMDKVRWPSAHLVGHSLGGLIALQAALSCRDRVRSLSLLCTFADGRIPTRLSPRMIWTGSRTRIGTRHSRRRAFLEFVLPREDRDAGQSEQIAGRLAPFFGHDLADQPPVVMKQLGAMKKCNLTPRLGELTGMPTLVISADQDPIAPPTAGRNMADGIPGATFVLLKKSSHGVPLHQPARINTLLANFLGQHL